MAEQVPAVCDVLDTIEQRNWERLRRLLHPEVHWTTAVEEHLLGPTAVIDCLSEIHRRRLRPFTNYAMVGSFVGSTLLADPAGAPSCIALKTTLTRWRLRPRFTKL